MERLVEQLVAWHNRHPLALRIAPGDVHTLGVVALPFMRGSRPADASEPTLTDEVSEEEALARAADAASSKAGAAPQAWWKKALFDALQLFSPRPTRGLLGELPWPVFSERFIPGLRPARVAHFALAHGYTAQPGEADWPQRIVAIDESLVAKASQGAWPMELYLASAGIDAGDSRTRVLIGQGDGSELLMLGRRCLDRRRVAALSLLIAALLAMPAWLLWPAAGPRQPAAPSAASTPGMAASAASSVASAPAVPASAPPSVATAAAASAAVSVAASAPPPAPALPGLSASELPNELAPPGTIPSIRPDMVSTPRTRKAAAEAASQVPKPAMAATASAPGPAKKQEPARAPAAAGTLSGEAPSEAAKSATARLAARSQTVVALVGPSLASKADAEAMLARMRAMAAQAVGDRSRLQAEVMQTPDGWRATIWPFATREEAQLINATMIARGMKTRAVDF